MSKDKFIEYHKANPQIWEAFETYTFKAISRGFKRFSAEFVFNVIRWEMSVRAVADLYKINNNFKPFYARMFMRKHPAYTGYFETRKSKADEESFEEVW